MLAPARGQDLPRHNRWQGGDCGGSSALAEHRHSRHPASHRHCPNFRQSDHRDRLRIVPADVATGQKTAIAAGKYIRRKLFVEVVTDGQGYSATNIEYQMTRWLSILSTISTIGRTSASVRVSKDY